MLNPLIRTNPTMKSLGVGRSLFYDHINTGLFVKPIRIGARATGFPANEVQAIINARIAGKSDPEIRNLVESLHAARHLTT